MKKFFYSVTATIANFSLFSLAHAVTISTNIPGGATAYPSSTGPGGFVANFYQFALMIAGILAFGIVVYGGVKYMTSVGNPSGQSDAKEWIEAALLGLLLLVGAYFILNVVNPKLTALALPPLTTLNIAAQPSTGGGTGADCSTLSCPTGFVPMMGGSSCVCQNATGQQGCGGGVQGTVNSCPSGTTCIETSNSPITYACTATAQQCAGPNYGTCPAGKGCVAIAGTGGTLNHICQ